MVWICLLGTAKGTIVALFMEIGNLLIWVMTLDMKVLVAIYNVRSFEQISETIRNTCHTKQDIKFIYVC